MTELRFPEAIDNTMMKDWRRCPQYFMRRHCQGLKVKDDEISIDLHFGKALAAGIEAGRRAYFVDRLPCIDAVDAATEAAAKSYGTRIPPAKNSKTLGNLLNAVCSYFRQWPLDEDTLVPVNDGIEYEFTIELPVNHPVTGKPLVYCGRMDMLARDEDTGAIVVVDEKTAGRFTDSWFSKWDMDTQLTGYLYFATTVFAAPGDTASGLIRGIGVSASGIDHVRVSVFRTPFQLAQWWRVLNAEVCNMVEAFELSSYLHRMGDSCYSYARPCEYTRLCTTPNPEAFYEQYEVNFWNPLQRDIGESK